MDGILLSRRMNWNRRWSHLIWATVSTSAEVQRGCSTADLTWDGLSRQWGGGAPLVKRGSGGCGTRLTIIRAWEGRN
jgi:hypothetical protein